MWEPERGTFSLELSQCFLLRRKGCKHSAPLGSSPFPGPQDRTGARRKTPFLRHNVTSGDIAGRWNRKSSVLFVQPSETMNGMAEKQVLGLVFLFFLSFFPLGAHPSSQPLPPTFCPLLFGTGVWLTPCSSPPSPRWKLLPGPRCSPGLRARKLLTCPLVLPSCYLPLSQRITETWWWSCSCVAPSRGHTKCRHV